MPLLFAIEPPAGACGPFLPQSVLTAPPESLWVAPVADLGHELALIAPKSPYPSSTQDAIDLELSRLRPLGVSEVHWRAWRRGERPDPPTLPAGLSQEFRLYAEGGAMWRRGEVEAATERLQALLALPEAERRERTLQATFMLARASGREEDFDRVLALVDAGTPDPLGLAVASLGEKGAIRLRDRDWRRAVDLYLAQVGAGGPEGVQSIRIVVGQAAAEGALAAWASDPVLSRVASAWLLARVGSVSDPHDLEATSAWLSALQAANAVMPEAERVAWMYYQVGDVPHAEAWLDRAAPSALGHWLRGRLLLRAGKLTEAEAELSLAGAQFSAEEVWDYGTVPGRERWSGLYPAREAMADAAMVRLSLEDWSGALGGFLAAGSWQDSAVVAERLLDLDEACAVAAPLPGLPLGERMLSDDGWARDMPSDAVHPVRPRPTVTATDLRYLLARRALREGKPVQITDFPARYRGDVLRLQEALRRGRESLSPTGRARGLWQAAVITRQRGLEILGYEMDPDYGAAAADFEVYPPTALRYTEDAETRIAPLPVRPEEARRWRARAPQPDQRFHYRYTAAKLAKEAADQLPDDDPDVPVLLCRAAGWLRVRDPDAADAYSREALRRTRRWPSRCGEPGFRGDQEARMQAVILGIALGVAGVVLGVGGRKRNKIV